MAIKTHYLIFSRESAFDLDAAFGLLKTVTVETGGGNSRPPDRVDVTGDEARIYFGPKYLLLSATPLPEAVALFHRVIQLDNYTERDQFVYKPGHALRVSAELDDHNSPTVSWCVTPQFEGLDYEGDEEPVYVRDPDEAVCFALVNHFPPAVFLMGSENNVGVLCFPSESDVRDSD